MGEISGWNLMAQVFSSTELTTGWEFKQTETSDGWMPVKNVPSVVQQDLIDNKKLDHPFIGFNEIKAEWVGTKSWTYRTKFQTEKPAPGCAVVLAFDGLDTYAQVKLDGKVVLESDNMFVPHRIDVTHATESRREHELEIVFAAALPKAQKIEKEHPDHKFICFNGDTARLVARKAQYSFSWDWGPLLIASGVWRPVRLEVYSARIAEIRTEVELSTDYKNATVRATANLEGHHKHDLRAKFCISLEGTVLATADERASADGTVNGVLKIDHPSLWMPSGYGSQSLYTLTVSILAGDEELHSAAKRIGLRKVELFQQPDSHGKSFYFRINGVDVFCGGSCWIPADSFLTNVTPQRLRSWIELLVPANQKMIRVWGGGIYEEDAFYDACDELGIMVWQDFMFACGNYPAYPSFLKSVREEAVANVKRIRHHPSVVIFAGNNEDYQVQESVGLTYDYDDKNEDNWLKSDFPARVIYESLLPKICAAEAPSIPYHPGSPWGDGKISSDPTVGDMHQWNVWHGTQEKYQIFDSLGGRFNSEFGMEAFPHIATIKSFVENATDLYPQSHVMDFHNKADGHERRIATYLVENVRTCTSLEAYIHLTQLIQCEALMFGYRGWRKQWGEDRHCGGALVWQMNDCWPCTSWSICDYYLRRKPSYYAMARTLAPVAVGIRRKHHDWSVTHAREPATQEWELWAVSSRLEDITADVEVRFISVEGGKEIGERFVRKGIRVQANGTTSITTGYVDNSVEEPHVLAARIWVEGELVARDTDWPQPLKYLHFPKRNVRVDVKGNKIHVTAERPVKCLVFEEREGCHLSDSAIDVVPGDEQVITVRGVKTGDPALDWTYLGQNEQ